MPYWCLLIVFLMTNALSAQELPTISIQGTLKDANGASVSDGVYAVVFRLFNQEVGGNPVWQEEATVEVIGGIYSHYLGSVNPLVSADFGSTLFLGLKVGSFELNPRTRMTYAPYTFASATVVCSGALGDVKYSILNPAKFAEENGDCWVPMDGRSIAGSRLSASLGISNLPDAGGTFFRAQEFATSPDYDRGRNSGSPIATVQGDDVKPHNHSMNPAGSHSHQFDRLTTTVPTGVPCGSNCYANVLLPTGYTTVNTTSVGDHTHTINNNSGDETRPVNLNLWAYIRIN